MARSPAQYDQQRRDRESVLADAAGSGRDYFSVAEVAAQLGVSRDTIRRWISEGRLPAFRVGPRTVRIGRDGLEQTLIGARLAGVRSHGTAWAPNVSRQEQGRLRHWVQFYERDDYLVRSVSEYLGWNLRTGAAAIVIATRPHREALELHWKTEGLDLAAARAAGRYLALDAAELLASFVGDRQPEPNRFAAVLDDVLGSVQPGQLPTRVFGEMVALLGVERNYSGAVRLEQLWNEVQRKRSFALLCAYPMVQLAGDGYSELVSDVCAVHNRVVPAESYSALTSGDGRLREIALLQQRASSLEAEIADRKRAEERERAARQSAEAALRLRDEFLSVASHELRTPLTTLTAYAQLALRRLGSDGAADPAWLLQALQAISGQARSLSRLVAQLLDISRLEAGRLVLQLQPVDLTKLAEQAVVAARIRSARHAITLEAPPKLELRADPLRLEQVLGNLLDNAVKYSPAGGPIEVVLARRRGGILLSVRDRGLGIPPEKREKLFERFYQAHGEGYSSGIGLGLYICRQIATLHGGDIQAEFPPDGGTRMLLRLPRDPGQRKPTAPSAIADLAPASSWAGASGSNGCAGRRNGGPARRRTMDSSP